MAVVKLLMSFRATVKVFIWHHNLIFGKINTKIPVPPAYGREVCDYKNANAEGKQQSISRFNWKKAFGNLN